MGKAAGNATAAAISAGYSKKTAYSQGQRLLKNVEIRTAIEKRQRADPDVATREERQRFWTQVMNDKDADIKDRLRASEILGKASGDFIDHVVSDNTTRIVVEYEDGLNGDDATD